jgi:serine phosphatase RsbU (regulator of sigma subunit)
MFSSLLKRARAASRSLRFKITWSAILAVAVSSIISNQIIFLTTSAQVRERTNKALVRSNFLLTFAVESWRQEVFKSLQLLSLNSSFRELNLPEMRDVFNVLRINYPNRRIAVWSPDGRLLLSSEPGGEGEVNQYVFNNSAFQDALRGNQTLQVLGANPKTRSCVFAARAIYPESVGALTGGARPKAILTFCLPFFLAEGDPGLSTDIEKTDSSGQVGKNRDVISMHKGQYVGSEFMMVRNNGYVVFPLTSDNDLVSGQSPASIKRGPWGPFVAFAMSRSPENHSFEITASGRKFIVVKRWLPDRRWAVLSIANRDTALRGLQAALEKLSRLQFATLLIVALVLYRVSGGTVEPIRRAGEAIRKISRGDFRAHIADERDDEVGDLFRDINATGALLSSYLESEKSHAADEQQIATAQQIQQSFLIKKLPESESFELAADFLPAYDIGADWYDSLRVGRFLYVIVADVCDKGVPSALFMSVFRSLLRSNILAEAGVMGEDRSVDLARVMTLVNEYMAINHAEACMFATIFAASYDTQTCLLQYVNAGHEAPIVLRGNDLAPRFESLEPTGPAVGLFVGARFSSGKITLSPGDLLFTFTDGLTDARSPADDGWGRHRLVDFLLQLQPEGRHPQAVLEQVLALVALHQAGAARYDDLTVLTLRILSAEVSSKDQVVLLPA